jgi:O-acetylserine/cysteine efflux transporter
MRFRDAVLAALTSVIWGLAFVATKLGLNSFSAAELTALRFLIACLPVFFVPWPRIGWPTLAAIGLTLFTGQFLLLFLAFKAGMPAGLASVTRQSQAFFTVLLAAVFLREVPSLRQCIGTALAFAGLAVIGLTIGGDLTAAALCLALAGAFQLGRRQRPGQAHRGCSGLPAGRLGEPRPAAAGSPSVRDL